MLKPISSQGWNEATAAHLLNRAGFGGPPEEIRRLAGLAPAPAISSFTDYEEIPTPRILFGPRPMGKNCASIGK